MSHSGIRGLPWQSRMTLNRRDYLGLLVRGFVSGDVTAEINRGFSFRGPVTPAAGAPSPFFPPLRAGVQLPRRSRRARGQPRPLQSGVTCRGPRA